MKPVTVEPESVSRAAGTQRAAAAQVRAQASAERIDTGALTGTFGVIGAEFLAALTDVGAQRTRTLDALAAAHTSTSSSTTAAQRAYDCCDSAGARSVAV